MDEVFDVKTSFRLRPPDAVASWDGEVLVLDGGVTHGADRK